MDTNQAVNNVLARMAGAVNHFRDEIKKLRTGRAHPSMLEVVNIEVYGTQMPLLQVATITAVDAQLLQVTPFDPGTLQAIASAIRNNPSLGLNPTDDGRVVRVPIPPLTEERRRDLAKVVSQEQEECMIALRGIRHEAIDLVDKAKKEKQIGEDTAKRLEHLVEDTMAKSRADAEASAKAKEQEIMSL
jgi:ribosome recycling factor